MPGCSALSLRLSRPLTTDSPTTTSSGRTSPWVTCRQRSSSPECSTGKSLLLSCLLDGGAYGVIPPNQFKLK
jgi:hypothetical protein